MFSVSCQNLPQYSLRVLQVSEELSSLRKVSNIPWLLSLVDDFTSLKLLLVFLSMVILDKKSLAFRTPGSVIVASVYSLAVLLRILMGFLGSGFEISSSQFIAL